MRGRRSADLCPLLSGDAVDRVEASGQDQPLHDLAEADSGEGEVAFGAVQPEVHEDAAVEGRFHETEDVVPGVGGDDDVFYRWGGRGVG